METTSPKFFCFVLMPFDKDFNDIYKFGIKGSCEDAGVYCERVDEQIFFEGSILDRIYNQISKADVIIADMTGRNPNVLYEVGYAHALNKPTILLTQNADDIPFDMKQFPHIIYGTSIEYIKEELTKRLIGFKEREVTSETYKTGIEVLINNKNLDKEKVIHEYSYNLEFQLAIHNSSFTTYKPGEFRVGIICKHFNHGTVKDFIKTVELGDGNYLHMLPSYDTLFPGYYLTSYVRLFGMGNKFNSTESENIVTIRVFTEAGPRDYNFEIKEKSL